MIINYLLYHLFPCSTENLESCDLTKGVNFSIQKCFFYSTIFLIASRAVFSYFYSRQPTKAPWYPTKQFFWAQICLSLSASIFIPFCSSASISQSSSIQYIIMRERSRSQQIKNESTINSSRQMLPVASLKSNFKTIKHYTHRSLSQSIVSMKSQTHSVQMRLPNSFYNDHSRIYQKKSKFLLERNSSFQTRPISLTERKRYDSDKIQRVALKYQKLSSIQNSQNTAATNIQGIDKKEMGKKRFKDVMSNKYKKFVLGDNMIKISKEVLEGSIKKSMSQKSAKKWKSPFEIKGIKDKFKGEQIIPKKIEKFYGNEDPTQLKVLNLDRLFQQRNGKLTNIIPLPVIKLNQISARSNIIKTVLHKDKIHEVIKQYNYLIRIMKLKKTAPKIAIKGKTFTKAPTIQQLMGIKLNPTHQALYPIQQLLSEDIFKNHCTYYRENMKKDVHLTKRLILGLCQQEENGISLQAFTRFYTLFVNNIASIQQKSLFLSFFFVPQKQDKIEFTSLRIILQLMCEQLPSIQKLNLKTDLLSSKQKSKIFLQALNRVLFGQLQSDFHEKGGLRRQILQIIFHNNPDATDLLLRLLQLD